MVPPEFANFFLASTGAAAALIGLLFVAIAIKPEKTVGSDAPIERSAVAASAFTALLNAFFVSMGSLLPGYNLGGFALIFSLIGVFNTLLLVFRIMQRHDARTLLLRRASLITSTIFIYGLEGFYAIRLIQAGRDISYVYTLIYLLISIYGIALSRAWELLGAQGSGLRGLIESLRAGDSPPHD